MKDNFDFYKTVVHQTLPRANCIWTPTISGAKKNVVLASEYCGGEYVFKFTDKNYAIRNSHISQAFRNAGIPAPEIIAQSCDNQWFEMYPAISGQTLYECVGNGISQSALKSIYSKILKLFEKMSYVDFSNIDFCDMQYAHQTAHNDTCKTNGALMGQIISAAVRIMNIGAASNIGLYHHGMTPKNIMISRYGEISGLLDIDEVGICNKNYAMGVLTAKAQLLGLDINALCDEYERVSGQRLNRAQVSTIARIQNFGRNILYRTKSK